MGEREHASHPRAIRPLLCGAAALAVAAGGLAVASAQGDGQRNEPALSYTALVVDAGTGAPIEGAIVSVAGVGAVESGANGTAAFELAGDAAWQAQVSAEGYADASGSALDGSLGDVEEAVKLYPEEPAAGEAPEAGAEEPPAEPEAPADPAPAPEVEPAPDAGEEPPAAEGPSPESEEALLPGEGTVADAGDVPAPAPVPEAVPPAPDAPLAQVPAETAPPAWALSGGLPLSGSLSMAEEMRALDAQLAEQAALVREELGAPEGTAISYDADNAADVWAAYAVLAGMEEGFPNKVEVADDEARTLLRSVYWAMTSVEGAAKAEGADRYVVHVERRTWEECAEELGIAAAAERLAAMTGSGSRAAVADLCEDSIVATLSDEEFASVEEALEGVEGTRRAVALAALSLEGKVPYFYGGKSDAIGWNPAWGQIATVSGDGTLAGGSAEPYGLDCSGYVTWAFVNACGTVDASAYIGHGTSAQWANSKAVDMADAQPGDLVFLAGPEAVGAYNHVGIVVANDEGRLAVAHCSGGHDNVVVTDASAFNHARTPYLYGQEVA